MQRKKAKSQPYLNLLNDKKRVWIAAGAIAAILILTGLTLWLLLRGSPKQTNKSETKAPILVHRAGGANIHTTLASALRVAKQGDTIRVQSDLEEQIRLNEAFRISKDITIEAEPGKKVVWRVPTKVGRKEPILEVANVDGLKIRKITLDGGGQLDQLVQVRGSNPGLTFDQLDLRGFLQFAVYLFNCKIRSLSRPFIVAFKSIILLTGGKVYVVTSR